MAKNVIFIQGAGAGAYKEDSQLVASLEHELGPGYGIKYPQMLNEDEPDDNAC